jgi:hypothetical protein
MSKVKLNFQADDSFHAIETELKTALVESTSDDDIQEMGWQEDVQDRLDQAQQLIRGCTEYVLQSFKDFGAAEVEEMTIKFGVKMGGKAGIPYITEGNAEGNIEIEIKCKF